MTPMYGPLRSERKKRLNRRAQARYRRRNPSHRMKYGHNFVLSKIGKFYYDRCQVCKKCGRKR